MNRILAFLFFMLILAGLAFSMLKNMTNIESLQEPALIDGKPATILSGEWRDEERYVTFTANGRIDGFSGCNRFFGSYIATDATISVDPLGSTRKSCEPSMMQAEVRFIADIETATTYRIIGKTLLLSSSTDSERALTLADDPDTQQ